MNFKDQLIERDACPSALAWLGDRDAETAWNECERGDWMLWALRKYGALEKRMSVTLAVEFAERVIHLINAPQARKALDTTKAWLRGEATEEECGAAADAAYAAVGTAYARAAAAYARAVAAGADAAAGAGAAGAGAADERSAQADIIRQHISWEDVKGLVA